MIKNKNIKICMVNPASTFLINKFVFPNLGLLTLSAVFKQNGYQNIEFIDVENNKDYSHIKADIFMIYCASPNVESAKEIMVELKKNNISSKFCIGGPHATLMPQDLMSFDAIIVGEGELASLQILKDYPNIKKIYKENRIENLDDIPFPDRSILDIKMYAENYKLRGTPSTTMITSRGCSWGKCVFCCKYQLPGSKVRYRSAENVIKEIVEIKEKYNINSFVFFDDEFVSNKRRLKEFCELVTPLNIKWRCLSRVESLNKKIISIMSEAGCIEIAVGIESADPEILNIIDKNIEIENAEKVCNMIKSAGINLKELFIIGLPGESHESLQKMDDFVERTQPFDVDFTVLSVFPGSDIYENSEKYDLKFNKKCRSHYKGIPGEYSHTVCRISTSKLTFDEIIEWREKLEKKYKPYEKLMKKE